MVSDEYIRMSREAKEIQEQWEPKPGDLIRRELTIFGEEIDTQIWDKEDLTPFEVLVRKPSIEGYWVATDKKQGKSVTLTDEDLTKNTCLWLPRQEDLQEFSLNNGDLQRITDYTNTFCKFIKKQHKEVTGYNNSWSKLWLLFVMETVYNKTWTGNGWVKQ